MSLEELGVAAGVVGVLATIATSVWQISVHKKSGRRVKVTSSYIIPIYEDADFDGPDFIQLEVINVGDKPVAVTNYAVELGKRGSGRNMWITQRPVWATRLPEVLEPGGTPVTLLVPVPELQRLRHELGLPFEQMHPWVDLADGRRIYSKNQIPMKD